MTILNQHGYPTRIEKMKKHIVLTTLLFLFFSHLTTAYGENVSKIIDWSKKKEWKTSSNPRDFAVSFDKKKIFILEQDNKVRVYANSYNGNRLGMINVAPTTIAIDIAPRGGMLYLIGSDKSYTAIEIVYKKKDDSIVDWSVKHTWKTANQPLDIAQSFDKKYAFILESDNNIHIYSIEGKKYRKVPVPSGTVAITIPSRKRTFSLVNRNRTYKNIKIPLL
jgi:mRNA-degrading endonuclease HigB of HigAB toxin-antitoxin module